MFCGGMRTGTPHHLAPHLGRHVVKRAGARHGAFLRRVDRQPEVGQLDGAAPLRQQDVLRLAVAPQEALHARNLSIPSLQSFPAAGRALRNATPRWHAAQAYSSLMIW